MDPLPSILWEGMHHLHFNMLEVGLTYDTLQGG